MNPLLTSKPCLTPAHPNMPLRSSPASPRKTLASAPRQVRIIGGQWRRSLLPVANVNGLRPTPDRVRETLFNWLHHLWDGQFHGRRVLDLFAGTGALGLEAASRGAAPVHLVEADRHAAQGLRQACERLQAKPVQVFAQDAAAFLRQHPEPYDLILLDPPFNSHWLATLLPQLEQHLNPHGLLYLESGQPLALPTPWQLWREGRAAAVHYGLAGLSAAP